MTVALVVRAWNVLFGDAILVSIPEGDTDRHILIDAGNRTGKGGSDVPLGDAMAEIHAQTGGTVDLYVMTHEHMDHVQGLLYASEKLGLRFQAREVWMTASADPGYYERYPEAKRRKIQALALWEGVAALAADPRMAGAIPEPLLTLLEINDPRKTADCVDHIRTLAAEPRYVHAGTGADPVVVGGATLRVLAPEADTSVYYRPFGPAMLGLAAGTALAAVHQANHPPPGVAAGDFFDLMAFRAGGMLGNLRAIDAAGNNSSLVLELEWQGWRLLFTADAELASWDLMRKAGVLRPVHFLKVSHHGSHNGTPEAGLDLVLPAARPDDRPRHALVSTVAGAYSGVPDDQTLARLRQRATLHDTRSVPPGKALEIRFPAALPGLVEV